MLLFHYLLYISATAALTCGSALTHLYLLGHLKHSIFNIQYLWSQHLHYTILHKLAPPSGDGGAGGRYGADGA